MDCFKYLLNCANDCANYVLHANFKNEVMSLIITE